MATEKQVKFAEDLKKLLFVRLDDYLDKSERNISKFPPKISNHKETLIGFLKNEIDKTKHYYNNLDASDCIDKLKNYEFDKILMRMQVLVANQVKQYLIENDLILRK